MTAAEDRPETLGTVRAAIRPFTDRASLAVRVALLTTAAVAATLAVLSAAVYVTVRAEFVSALDQSMLKRAHDAVDAGFTPGEIDASTAEALDVAGIKILVLQGGRWFTQQAQNSQAPQIPFDEHETAVSIGQAQDSRRTVWIDKTPYRVVAVQAGSGAALVLAQPMDNIVHSLTRLKVILLASSFAGMIVAGGAGWMVATNGLRPVRRLTAATERVARTFDLHPIEVTGHDELARLGASFNQMLVALAESQARQRRLVADAGHELRTPLTSLRTNIELLGQAADDPDRTLSADQRHEIMADVRSQLEELTALVHDLVELARDEPLSRDPAPLDLADVVQAAVERVRPRAVDVVIDPDLETYSVVGEEGTLERAVTNLLDNAVKWSPTGGTVHVTLRAGVLTVRDEGPGINADDLPHVFERFYRSREARTLPGSGLGLSIVRSAVERHGGTVSVASSPRGGTTFTVALPPA